MARITLAAPYTDRDGKTHKADTPIDVDPGVAADLTFVGRARDADSVKKAADTGATKKES